MKECFLRNKKTKEIISEINHEEWLTIMNEIEVCKKRNMKLTVECCGSEYVVSSLEVRIGNGKTGYVDVVEDVSKI